MEHHELELLFMSLMMIAFGIMYIVEKLDDKNK